jgi:sugar-phosphatase
MTKFATRGLLFDSDGVLVDSHEAAAAAWNEWAATYAPSFDFHRDIIHGVRMSDTVAGLVAAEHTVEAERALVELELATTAGVVAMPGAISLLQSLPTAAWTVVTSALRSLAIARLGAAGLPPIEHLIAAEDVSEGKPAPEPYRAGATLLRVSPSSCTVFEDAPAGIAAAHAAGVGVVVGIGAGALRCGATIVVPDLRSVRFFDGVLTVNDAARLD